MSHIRLDALQVEILIIAKKGHIVTDRAGTNYVLNSLKLICEFNHMCGMNDGTNGQYIVSLLKVPNLGKLNIYESVLIV